MLSRRQWLKWSERPNKSRLLDWLGKGGLIFLFTWLIWLAVSDAALAADPSGAEALGGNPGAPVDYVWIIINASYAWVEGWAAVVIGLVAGILVILGVYFFDKIGVDDPAGTGIPGGVSTEIKA